MITDVIDKAKVFDEKLETVRGKIMEPSKLGCGTTKGQEALANLSGQFTEVYKESYACAQAALNVMAQNENLHEHIKSLIQDLTMRLDEIEEYGLNHDYVPYCQLSSESEGENGTIQIRQLEQTMQHLTIPDLKINPNCSLNPGMDNSEKRKVGRKLIFNDE